MLLKAGAVSLALLLASRVLGLARESAQASAFGTSGLADVAILVLTLPDWITGLVAGGALAYAMLPHWARQTPPAQAEGQRRVAQRLCLLAVAVAVALWLGRTQAVAYLAAGVPTGLQPSAASALGWSALALPPAMLAALWITRLQFLRDFVGMYAANLVVNAALLVALLVIAARGGGASALAVLGACLVAAMALRLVWLRWRLRAQPQAEAGRDNLPGRAEDPAGPHKTAQAPVHPQGHARAALASALGLAPVPAPSVAPRLPVPVPVPVASPVPLVPPLSVWTWAALSAGLPLALPFMARSIASQGGEGALATFNYAWKLVELPLVLAVQLVATLAFPAVAQALADRTAPAAALRRAFWMAWTLAAAAAAGLLLAAPAAAQLLFGWGRMAPDSVARIAEWGAAGAWGLLPQALIAVALTALASLGRLRAAVAAYAAAVAGLLLVGRVWHDGAVLMHTLNLLLVGVAATALWQLRAVPGLGVRAVLPWPSMAVSTMFVVGAWACQASGWTAQLFASATGGPPWWWTLPAAAVYAAVLAGCAYAVERWRTVARAG